MAFFGAIGSYFAGLFMAIIGQLGIKTAQFLKDFAEEDLGKSAIDAVEYVEASIPGAGGVEKRDAAVAKLKTDAAMAGHDITAFATSTLNWLIETALQASAVVSPAAPATKPATPPATS